MAVILFLRVGLAKIKTKKPGNFTVALQIKNINLSNSYGLSSVPEERC